MPVVDPPFEVLIEGGIFTVYFQTIRWCTPKLANIPYYSFKERPGEIYPSDRCIRLDGAPCVVVIAEAETIEACHPVAKLREIRELVKQPITSFAHFERRQDRIIQALNIAIAQTELLMQQLREAKQNV